MRLSHLVSSLLIATLWGCNNTRFPPEEIVEKDRPLAGRVSVLSDPARATPAPGERAEYEFLVVSPGKQVEWRYFFAVCRLARDARDIALCKPDAPFIALTSLTAPPVLPPDDLPSVTFTVPELASLEPDEDELLVQGFLCPDSDLDPALLQALVKGDSERLLDTPNPCRDKSKNGLFVATPFRIQRTSADVNHTPSIAAVSWSKTAEKTPIRLAQAWDSEASAGAPTTGCKGTDVPQVKRSKSYLGLQLKLAPGARETYAKPSLVAEEAAHETTEIPRVEGFASAGTFKIVRDNQLEDGQILQLTWQPPQKHVPEAGLLVRFWFLASDDRDGSAQTSSWQARALCVVP